MYNQDPGRCRKPTARLSADEIQLIEQYLQGAVYCWCAVKNNDWFRCSDFTGGSNCYWQDTPLFKLYEWFRQQGKNEKDAIKMAGYDAGHILKRVIRDDKRYFFTRSTAKVSQKNGKRSREYAWDNTIPDEDLI